MIFMITEWDYIQHSYHWKCIYERNSYIRDASNPTPKGLKISKNALGILWPSSNEAISRRRRWWLGILRKWLAAGKSISRSLGAIPASDWWIGRAIDVWRGGAALPSFQSPTQSISLQSCGVAKQPAKDLPTNGVTNNYARDKRPNFGEEYVGAIGFTFYLIIKFLSWTVNTLKTYISASSKTPIPSSFSSSSFSTFL